MGFHVFLRKLNGDGEDLNTDDHSRDFLGNVVLPAPSLRIEGGNAPRPKDDANKGGQWRLGQVEAIVNELREESIGDKEERENKKGEVR